MCVARRQPKAKRGNKSEPYSSAECGPGPDRKKDLRPSGDCENLTVPLRVRLREKNPLMLRVSAVREELRAMAMGCSCECAIGSSRCEPRLPGYCGAMPSS